ncbi:MAG: cytochrome c biogenesis protein CcsA [Bdellovibrionota bacterium]
MTSSIRIALSALALVFMTTTAWAETSTAPLRFLPVQDQGRVKPFDTLARETLQLIYGSQTYQPPKKTEDEKAKKRRDAVEIVMTWLLVPQFWDTQKIVEVSHRGLKDSLKLPADEKHFTPDELFKNERLSLIFQELAAFRETKEKLNPYYQAAQRLESQLGSFQMIKQGTGIRVAPPKPEAAAGVAPNAEAEKWVSVSELDGELKEKFSLVARAFIQNLPSDGDAQAPPVENPLSLEKAVDDFKTAARSQNAGLYPPDKDIAIEVHYKAIHPFLYSWILYLLAAIFMGVAWQTDKALFTKLGWAAASIAFAIHTYGFVLRMIITGRPPVSNMYESVVWVSWGTIVFSMIFEKLQKKKFILLAGAVVAVICLVVADLAPTILDRSLQPLEPVLRSNMWLTVHVLTITLSYSAFFLAWGLGNIGLAFILRGDKPTAERPRAIALSIYRAMQVGIVLLAAGTILGGVWADYSWGRFWGWDPKETWAFIERLGSEFRNDGWCSRVIQPRHHGLVRSELRFGCRSPLVRLRRGRRGIRRCLRRSRPHLRGLRRVHPLRKNFDARRGSLTRVHHGRVDRHGFRSSSLNFVSKKNLQIPQKMVS